jgi:nitroimidazol reductase NimA-like FMN-containing flavoprotein (pyridoxamine 5'-phosphate oxidase superfamily)
MHSHTKGEKIENIKRNNRVGFEVDKSLEFLPSYFTDPLDASQADTLYISVVIKGIAALVSDRNEKTLALNALMKKYQPEGRYENIRADMKVVDEVAIIKVTPSTMRGKYKIGQHLDRKTRLELAQKILERNTPTAKSTLEIMGIKQTKNGLEASEDPLW